MQRVAGVLAAGLMAAACSQRVEFKDPQQELAGTLASAEERQVALSRAVSNGSMLVRVQQVYFVPGPNGVDDSGFKDNVMADLSDARARFTGALKGARHPRLRLSQDANALRVVVAGTLDCHISVITLTDSCDGNALVQLRDPAGLIVWDAPVGCSSSATHFVGRTRVRNAVQECVEDAGKQVSLLLGQVAELPPAPVPAPVVAAPAPEVAAVKPAPAGGALAAGQRVAVLEFRSDGSLPQAVLAKLADSARAGVLAELGPRGVLVMTRESMAAMMKDMGTCNAAEGECEVETARNIGADGVVTGEVLRVEGTWVITLKLFAAAKGTLLATREVRATSQLELFSKVEQAAAQMAH